MEHLLLDRISEQIKANKKVAWATVTKIEGSTPRKEGAMMAIFEDGRTLGTVGGGTFEAVVTEKAKMCLSTGESRAFHFQLNDEEGSLHMQCGGTADVFIKVFVPKDKLLIVGGGHIALELYQLGKLLGFYTAIFEDRESFLSKERFPEADELILGNIEEQLSNYPVDKYCHIVIVTRGHRYDEAALRVVIDRDAGYIGMIGSKNKTKYVMDRMKEAGISTEKIRKVYAPIGLDLGGETPMEIALSILGEILLVKNKRTPQHMRDRIKE
ncbi:XdhC family protein [Thermotalea metallivorans]|uniref:Putative xanthine dehydrogenase subunit A n=1 Tax=Thermotalea metallivorans TaxID=520762 RepID=A0A140L145_9FIRM|nr:XdhC/CoxI family protein [Thermotalea metallivorans]KXG74270.1 putative xanthine dehydrogenase subunit A [Thermotalea metallivorans]